ncbi:putative DNA-dependent protein kinase catalytic subunit-like, partial [Sesbania bispinosa]
RESVVVKALKEPFHAPSSLCEYNRCSPDCIQNPADITVIVASKDYIHKEMRVHGKVPSDLRVQQDSL